MNNILSITSVAADQIKKIVSNAPDGVDSVIIGIDKSGCSGYSYKLDFGKSSNLKNFETINKDGAKVLIDPKATMFLLGSTMDILTSFHVTTPGYLYLWFINLYSCESISKEGLSIDLAHHHTPEPLEMVNRYWRVGSTLFVDQKAI